jgi:hypothetical protein
MRGMKKPIRKILKLDRETVRVLTDKQLAGVGGGSDTFAASTMSVDFPCPFTANTR